MKVSGNQLTWAATATSIAMDLYRTDLNGGQ